MMNSGPSQPFFFPILLFSKNHMISVFRCSFSWVFLYNFLSSTLIQATHRHDLNKPKQRLQWLKEEEPIVIEYICIVTPTITTNIINKEHCIVHNTTSKVLIIQLVILAFRITRYMNVNGLGAIDGHKKESSMHPKSGDKLFRSCVDYLSQTGFPGCKEEGNYRNRITRVLP